MFFLRHRGAASLRAIAIASAAAVIIGCGIAAGQALAGEPTAAVQAAAFTSDRLSVEVIGSGPDVILIPGLASSREVWRPLATRLADGSDVHPQAVAFEARMPAGLARMIYWPADDEEPGFCFAVESRNRKGWNRFLLHRYQPAET